MKNFGKPIEILAKLNEMAGFAPLEEIELYEVCLFNISLSLFDALLCREYPVTFAVNILAQYVQEIKFEPSVMCELLDKRTTFRFSQVFIVFIFAVAGFIFRLGITMFSFCRLRMGTLFATKKSLPLRVKNNVDILMFLPFWNMCITARYTTNR